MDGAQARIFTKSASGGQSGAGEASRSSLQNSKNSALNSTSSASSAAQRSSNFEASSPSSNVNANGNRSENVSVKKQQLSSTSGTTTKGTSSPSVNSSTANSQQQTSKSTNSSSNVVHNNSSNNLSSSNSNGAQSVTAPNKRPNQSSSGNNNNGSNTNSSNAGNVNTSSNNSNSRNYNTGGEYGSNATRSGGAGTGRVVNNRSNEYGETGNYNSGPRPSNKQRERDDTSGYSAGGGGYGNENAAKNDSYYYRENSRRPGGSTATTGSAAAARGKPPAQQQQPASKQRQQYQEYYEDEGYEYDETDYNSRQNYGAGSRGGTGARRAVGGQTARAGADYNEKEPVRRGAGQSDRRGGDGPSVPTRDDRTVRTGGTRREQQPTTQRSDKSGKDDEKGWEEDQEAGQWDTAATGGRGAKSGAAASARAHHTAASQQPSSGSPSVNSVSATGTPATGSGGELVNDELPSSTLNGSSSAAGGGRAPSREQQNAALSAPAGESTWPSVSEWNSPSAANVTSSNKEEQDFGGVWDANEKAANKFSAVAVNSTTAGMKPKDPYGDIMLSGAVGHRSGSNPSAANLNDNSGNDFNSDLRSGSTGGVSTNRRSVPPLGVGSNEADYLGTSRWGNPTSSSNTNQPVSSTPSSGTQNNNRQGGVNSGGSFVGMWTNSTVAGGGAPSGAQNHIPNWENLTKFTKQDSGSTDTGRGSVSASAKPTIPDNPNSPASLGNNSMFGNMPGGNAGGPQPLIASMQQQIDFNFMQQISKIQAAAAAAAIAPGSLPLPRPEIGGVPGLHNTNRPHMMSQIATSNIGSMQSPAASFVNSFTFPGGSNSIGGGGGGLAGIGSSGPLPVPGGAARWQPPAGGPFGASNATMGVSPASNQALEMFSQLNAETAKLAAAAAAAGNLHQQQQQQQQSGINAALLGMQSHLAHQHPGASSQQQQSQMLPPHLQQQGGQHQQHGPLGNMGQPQPPFGQQMFLNQFHHQQVQQQQHAEQQQKMLLQQQQQQQANEEMRKQQQELLQQQRQREDNDRRAAAEAAASAVAAAAAQAAAGTVAAEKRRQQEAEEAELNRADDEYEAELRSLNWEEQFRALGGANASSNDYSACKKRVNELHEKFQSTLRNMAAAPSRDELTNLIAITRFMLEAGEQCFLRDSVRSYAEGLHDVVWKHGLHALLSFMRREHDVVGGGADSQQSSKSQRVHGRRGLTVAISVVLDFGIYFLQQLVSRVLGLFGGCVDALSLQLASNLTNSQEKVLKLAAYLDIALGDLYRYKGSLLSVGANAKSAGEGKGGESQQRQLVRLEMRHAFKHARYCYEDAYNLCATDGYAQNQLALVSRLERCYLDMVYHCVRALSVPKQPFLLAQQMLNDTLREIGNTYENSLDKKLSPGSIGQLDLPTLMRECNLLFLYFHSLIGSNNKNFNEMHASTTPTTTPNSNKQPSTIIRLGSATGTKQSAESVERQQQQYQQIIFDFLTRWKAVLAHGICEPVRSIFLKMNVINMYVLSNAMGNPAVFPPVIDLCLHMFAALVERLLDVLNEASSTSSAAAASVSLPSGGNATLSGSSGSSTVGAASSGNTVEHQLEAIIMDEQVALLMSCCKAFCDWLVTHIAAWNPLPATPFLQSAEWTYERMLTLLAELCTVSRQINLQGVNELVPYRTERVVPFQLIEDTFARNMSSIREAHVIFHNEPSLTREVAEMRARMSRFMLLGNMFATMQNPVFEFDVQTLDLRPVPKYIDKSLEGKYRRLRLVQPSPSLHLSVALQAAAAAQATVAATGGAVQPPAAVTPNPAVMNFFNNVLPAPPPQAALSAMTPQQQHDLFASSPAAAAMYAPAHGANAAANAIPFGAPRWNAHRTMSNTGRTPQGLMAPAMHAPPPPPPASAKVEDWPDLMDADIVATSQYPTSATVGGARRKGDSESSAGAGGMYRGMYSNGLQQQQNIPSPSSTPGVAGGSMDFDNLPATTPPVTPSATSGSTTSASTTAANKDVKSSIAQPWWLIDKNMRREAMRMEGGVKRDNMLSTRTDSSKSSGDADHSDQAANSASAANNQRKYLFVDTNALLKGGGDCVKKLMTEESRMAVMVPSVVVRELTNHTKDLSRSHEEQSDAHAALDFIFELSTKRDSRVKIVSIGGLLLKDSQAAMKENAWERGSNDDLILKCVKNAVEKGFIATELKNASTVPLSGASATSSGPARPPLVAFLTEDVNLRTKARRELIEARSLQDVSDAKFKWV